MEKESLKMRFNGHDEIDLETLSHALNSTLDCLKTIADNVLAKGDYCKFSISNVDKGSFIIDISVLKEIVENFLNNTATIVGIFVGICQLRKFFKGKAPKKIEKDTSNNTVVINANGEKLDVHPQVINIYISNPDIESSLAQINSILSKDDGRTSLSVEEKNTNGEVVRKVDYSKNELSETAKPIDLSDFDADIEESMSTEWLKIKTLHFKGDAKWEFILVTTGTVIAASIEDTTFLKNIQNNETSVAAETRLNVRLRTRIKLDKQGQYTNKRQYSILEVIEIRKPNIHQVDLTITET
mgnify:FL=1